jgi:hypothetical protein
MEEGCRVQWMTVADFLAQSKFRDFYANVLPSLVESVSNEGSGT